MMHITKPFKEGWFMLPVISALLVIGTLPPLKLWWLGFVCLSPIYIFTRISRRYTWKKTALGGFLFGTIFTGFILSLTVLQFHWVKEVYLFTEIIRLSSFVILVLLGAYAAFQILISRTIVSNNALVHIFFASSFWTLSEWVMHKLMFGIEYSIIGYPAYNSIFIVFARYGGVYATIFIVALINISIGSIAYYWHTRLIEKNALKNIKRSVAVLLFCTCAGYVLNAYLASNEHRNISTTSTMRIAILQNQDRDLHPFGQEKKYIKNSSLQNKNTVHGSLQHKGAPTSNMDEDEIYFSFPKLQDLVLEAQKDSNEPMIIVYPFAPWNGAIAEKKYKNAFNKNVIATDFETFGTWTENYIKKDNIFVVWNTTYRDGLFFNEIHFWKNGALIGYTQKELLFPFLDYTPAISQSIGLYTTPIDTVSGTSTLENMIDSSTVGTLICSEITHPIYRTTSKNRDIVFAIGSEALFSSGVAGEFNLGNAAYRAAESGVPIVRANRLGPSAIISSVGKIESTIGFKEDAILYDVINVHKKNRPTPFEQGGGNIFILSILVLAITLYWQNRK